METQRVIPELGSLEVADLNGGKRSGLASDINSVADPSSFIETHRILSELYEHL